MSWKRKKMDDTLDLIVQKNEGKKKKKKDVQYPTVAMGLTNSGRKTVASRFLHVNSDG